jgi:hypothetical protein
MRVWLIHAECNFYTQSVIETSTCVIITRSRLVFTSRVRFSHTECDFTRRVYAFYTHENKFDTYECEYDTLKCDFYTLECYFNTQECDLNTKKFDFDMQSVILHAKCDLFTHECNFNTYECDYGKFE